MGDVGQEEDFAAAEAKAYKIGAKKFFLAVSLRQDSIRHPCAHSATQDLKREFVEHLIYPAVQANCIYEVSTEFLIVYISNSY